MVKGLEGMTESSEILYTKAQALEKSTKYFHGDNVAAEIWQRKYALKDKDGNLLENNPDQMHRRLAREIARIEAKYKNPLNEDQVYELIKDFRYMIPQGGPMAGIGDNNRIVSLSNCFVVGNTEDSYGGIFLVEQEQVQLMKRRGGVGHDLSHIRPANSLVQNSAQTSTGVVPFMKRYSNSTREVAQGGRRGALMLSISVQHPDAEKFIDAKTEKREVTDANISVRISDEFMLAVKNGTKYTQQFPIGSSNPSIVQEINAKELWDKIVHNAWKSAEPGILFWDTITRESIPDRYSEYGYKSTSTNPCGEIPLCPYDSCRLLALNLYSYVENPFTPQAKFNFELFKSHAKSAQRIMDDIVDLEGEKIIQIQNKIERDPEEEFTKLVEKRLWKNIEKKNNQGRRTGIGITAEGDMLAALNLRYGSEEAIDFSTEVHKTLALGAYAGSVDLAEERGAFEIYDAEREKDNPFITRIREADPELYQRMVKHGRRNIALLTIAPTGTTSMMSQTTSGIENIFLPVYKRKTRVNPEEEGIRIDEIDEEGAWQVNPIFHHKFEDWLRINGKDVESIKNLAYEALTKKHPDKIAQLDEILRESPYYKATSADVDWVAKVKMQGAIQKWVDHSISVTVNLPQNVDEKTVSDVYLAAWEAECKGITVYREGSREGVLSSGKAKEENGHIHDAPKRPNSLEARIVRFKNNDEDWLAAIGLLEGAPYEIFTGKVEDDVLLIPKSTTKGEIVKIKENGNPSRYDFRYVDKYGNPNTVGGLSHMFDPQFHNYAKLISGILRHGMPIAKVVELISSLTLDNENINSWKAGVNRALKGFIPDGTKASSSAICEGCGEKGTLIYNDGCKICNLCGHSHCGG
jgi:ribonucleoside-diphosphate reductase alpha chain